METTLGHLLAVAAMALIIGECSVVQCGPFLVMGARFLHYLACYFAA